MVIFEGLQPQVAVCVDIYCCEGVRRSPHVLGCGLTGDSGEEWKNTVQEIVALFIYTGTIWFLPQNMCPQNKQT